MKLLHLLTFPLIFSVAVFAQNQLSESQKTSAEVVRLFQSQKYDEALPAAKKAISLTESEFGKKHVALASAWRNLAYIELKRGSKKEAAAAFEKALSIYEDIATLTAKDQKNYAEMLETVAINNAVEGDYISAEKKLLKAVEMREVAGGKDSPDIAFALLRLSEIHRLQSDYEKAEPLLTRAFDIKSKDAANLDNLARDIYESLSCINTKLGREKENEKLRERLSPVKTEDSSLKPLSGGILNGKALSLPKPSYPQEAREKRASGAVSVKVLIDEKGNIISACAVSGSRLLHQSVEYAALQSKFSPTTLQGKPVKVSGIITYNFVY